MSRKRYSSDSKRYSSPQGQFKSTSPQGNSYEDSLAAECLIKAFLDLGGMEDPVLKVLFIGGSKPKQGETEMDLAFRRLKSCWLEKKERTYGMKEVLKMKMIEKGIKVDVNPKWAKFSIMGAPLVITPKIWINKVGDEKNCLKDFQLDIFRDAQNLSECSIRIQQNGYMNTIQTLGVKVIVHRWYQFPDKEPVRCGNIESKKIFHVLIETSNSTPQNLESFYQDENRSDIQLIQQDWSNYICIARGRKKILSGLQRKVERPPSRSQSRERLSYNSVFKAFEQQKQNMLKEVPIQEAKISDADSVRSQQLIKKLRIDSLSGMLIQPQSVVENELAQVMAIEEVFNKYNSILKTLNQEEVDLIPKEIFPNGLSSFVADHGCNNYLKLFLNLNWLQLRKINGISKENFYRRGGNCSGRFNQILCRSRNQGNQIMEWKNLTERLMDSSRVWTSFMKDLIFKYSMRVTSTPNIVQLGQVNSQRPICIGMRYLKIKTRWYGTQQLKNSNVALLRNNMRVQLELVWTILRYALYVRLALAGKIYLNTPAHRLWPSLRYPRAGQNDLLFNIKNIYILQSFYFFSQQLYLLFTSIISIHEDCQHAFIFSTSVFFKIKDLHLQMIKLPPEEIIVQLHGLKPCKTLWMMSKQLFSKQSNFQLSSNVSISLASNSNLPIIPSIMLLGKLLLIPITLLKEFLLMSYHFKIIDFFYFQIASL